jgi:hypothetical protein
MKPVRLSAHALSYTEKRGFTQSEVEEAIATVPWKPAEQGADRFECSKEFAFNQYWNGRHFSTKQVRPIFIEEPFEILVVTVYTYYY